jgi:hypothetical protein
MYPPILGGVVLYAVRVILKYCWPLVLPTIPCIFNKFYDQGINTHGRIEKCIEIVFGKYGERKKPFGIPKRRCEDNIKMCLKGIAWQNVDCFHSACGG